VPKKRPAGGKASAKKKPVKNKQVRKASTPNGQMIQDLMAKRKVRGNYKDFVVIAGNRLVDWTESWDIFSPAGDAVGFEGVVLLHKSGLKDVVGGKLASKMWRPKFGRIHPDQAKRNPNQAKAAN